MADFRQGGGRNNFGGNRGGYGGGRPNFQKKSWGGDRGPAIMHKAICDQCHKPCEVPFLPTAGKPVYCKACFGGKQGGDKFSQKNFGGDYKTPPRTDFGNDVKKVNGEEIKKQIEVLNGKIDKLTRVIEAMTPAKAVVAKEKTEKAKKPVKKASAKK